MDGVYSKALYCSFDTLVARIKFYRGIQNLRPLTWVKLQREHNPFDCNSILVVIAETGEKLGHLHKKAAAALVCLMDAKLSGLIICG